MTKRNKLILLSILSILIVFCLVLGITYSFMKPVNDTDSIMSVSLSSCANITLIDNGNSIDLENSYPMSMNRAMQTEPYVFTVTSTCDTYVGFSLYLASLSTNTLNDSNIHYIITEHDSKEILIDGVLSDASDGEIDFESYEIEELKQGINSEYTKIYKLYSDALPYQGTATYDLYLYIDESVTNETMNQTFNAGIAVKAYKREEDSTVLALDISLGNIEINVGSSEDKLYVSGGGLTEQIEIDSSNEIIITGSTEEFGITVNGGTSNLTLNNVSISTSSGTLRLFNDSTVNLNLIGENTLVAGASSIETGGVGLYVAPSSTIVIDGDGTLNATGAIGIGGPNAGYYGYLTAGSIIINSGTVNATGTSNSGIGGENFVLIEINGGTVTAISEGIGAGIGGNGALSSGTITGQININGGTVYAQGSGLGAGIGGGGMRIMTCNSISTAPNIYISENASVTAIAGTADYGEIQPEAIGSGGYSCGI